MSPHLIPQAAGVQALSYFVAGVAESPDAALARLHGILGDHESLANLAAISSLAAATSALLRMSAETNSIFLPSTVPPKSSIAICAAPTAPGPLMSA